MNKIYTQQDISKFFNQFKELPNSFELDKVLRLISDPNAQARHMAKPNYKPLKIIIMTSAFIVGTAALMIWLVPNGTSEVANQKLLKTQPGNQTVLSEVRKGYISPEELTQKAFTGNYLNIKVEQFPEFSAPAEVFTTLSESQESKDSIVEEATFLTCATRNITEGMRLIELSKPELQKLGFMFSDSSIRYDNRLFEINLFKEGEGITLRRENSILECVATDILFKDTSTSIGSHYLPINLVYLSDEFGEQNLKWITNFDNEDKNTPEYFWNRSQFLIPILLRKSDYPELMSQNQVFWFEPSAALFDSLPANIGQQLAQEYNYILADKNEKLHLPASNCVYFEACKSTLEIDDLKIYPNPAQLNTTIDFTLPESISGSVSLVSISGTQMKFLVPATTFREGHNSFIVDISDVVPGIYLVLLSTEKGFKTQRLIITK